MSFERFTITKRGYSPKLSISPHGMLSLNNGAVHRYDLSQYPFCILYYDRAGRRIGIELTVDEQAEGVRRLRLGKNSGAFISARAFVEYYGITPDATTVYPLRRDEETGMLVVDLTEGVQRRTRR